MNDVIDDNLMPMHDPIMPPEPPTGSRSRLKPPPPDYRPEPGPIPPDPHPDPGPGPKPRPFPPRPFPLVRRDLSHQFHLRLRIIVTLFLSLQ